MGAKGKNALTAFDEFAAHFTHCNPGWRKSLWSRRRHNTETVKSGNKSQIPFSPNLPI